MVERICPECRMPNAVDADICAECGVQIEQSIVRRANSALAHNVGVIPARWQRAGKAVALGAVAVAVEVGAAWLQQRSNKQPALARRIGQTVAQRAPRYVARQRVWETYEQGSLTRRVTEQTVWHLPED